MKKQASSLEKLENRIAPATFAPLANIREGADIHRAEPGPEGAGSIEFAPAMSYDVNGKPLSLAVGDVNGDGFRDLLTLSKATASITILSGNADGTFGAPKSFSTGGKKPNSFVFRDFDKDGDLDIATSNAGSKEIAVFTNDGMGSYSVAATIPAGPKLAALEVRDLTGDGARDLVGISGGSKLAIFVNDGSGGFTPREPIATGGKGGVQLLMEDFNGDGAVDLAVANAGSRNVSFLAGAGAGQFAAPILIPAGKHPTALTAADFNGDSVLDFAVADRTSKFVGLFLGAGSAAPSPFSPMMMIPYTGKKAPVAIEAADLDDDGRVDLIIANGFARSFTVLRGQPDGVFTPPREFVYCDDPHCQPMAMALSDLNGDGLLDIALASRGGSDVDVVFRT